jgi:hypothetical protein
MSSVFPCQVRFGEPWVRRSRRAGSRAWTLLGKHPLPLLSTLLTPRGLYLRQLHDSSPIRIALLRESSHRWGLLLAVLALIHPGTFGRVLPLRKLPRLVISPRGARRLGGSFKCVDGLGLLLLLFGGVCFGGAGDGDVCCGGTCTAALSCRGDTGAVGADAGLSGGDGSTLCAMRCSTSRSAPAVGAGGVGSAGGGDEAAAGGSGGTTGAGVRGAGARGGDAGGGGGSCSGANCALDLNNGLAASSSSETPRILRRRANRFISATT